MGMVFCRGCGKEIHETALTCPHCGAPQGIPSSTRSVGKLIGWTIVWTVVFWFVSLFFAGMIAGFLHPDDASLAGRKIGEAYNGMFFLIALCLSSGLTVLGWLPGTRKPSMPVGDR